MVTLDWDLATAGEVTLVHVAVRTETPCTVRLRNELDGPVWPPRTQGRPAPGWDDDGYEGVVAADRPLVLGYAVPAPPADPPVTVVEEGPPDTAADTTDPVAVVRALGESGPPRAAIPQLDATSTASGADDGDDTRATPPGADQQSRTAAGTAAPPGDRPAAGRGDEAVPPAVEDWLQSVADRAERAEGLDGVASVAAAREAVDDAGGLAAIRDLDEQLQADREALTAVVDRCERLRDRVEHADVPTATLERLG